MILEVVVNGRDVDETEIDEVNNIIKKLDKALINVNHELKVKIKAEIVGIWIHKEGRIENE